MGLYPWIRNTMKFRRHPVDLKDLNKEAKTEKNTFYEVVVPSTIFCIVSVSCVY